MAESGRVLPEFFSGYSHRATHEKRQLTLPPPTLLDDTCRDPFDHPASVPALSLQTILAGRLEDVEGFPNCATVGLVLEN
jgi:hypothetical protein